MKILKLILVSLIITLLLLGPQYITLKYIYDTRYLADCMIVIPIMTFLSSMLTVGKLNKFN